jgi:hypothetical protein
MKTNQNNREAKTANGANQPPNQPGDTANNDDIPARAIARRRIDAVAIAEIAKLCAKQLTESEACRRLGIQPRAWFNFKDRAGRGEKFKALLEAYRAHRIEHLIDRIEKSADGIGVKYPDFRAALALLKITDQKRFGDSPLVNVQQVNANILSDADMQRVMDKIFRENPELEADILFTDVRLGYRKRESLEWIQTPGQPPKRTKIRPEVRELLMAKLNAKPAVEISASVEPKQIENA